MFLNELRPLVIEGNNFFEELDLDCFINGTELIRARVNKLNKTHLLCELSVNISKTGEYQFMIYSHSIN
jgi:hypothetical protein